MMKELKIDVTLSTTKKEKQSADKLEFGKTFTDHMFVWDYKEGEGWHNARIVPYQPITLEPAATVFHYGQTVFEGLKAYLTKNEEILLFRPDENMKRLNRSNDRLCMPEIDEELALSALKQLLMVDREWIPGVEGTSLYILPFMIATDPHLGVSVAKEYQFMIIMSPVGAY